MRYFFVLLTAGVLFFTASCTTSSLSRSELDRLASTLNYIVIPGSVFGTEKDVRVHYEEVGNTGSPAMILIHGFGSSSVTWQKCLPGLAEQYHVYTIDMPGFGFSDKYRDFPYTLEGFVKVVLEFMDRKGIEKAIVGGNSMGGGISLRVAIDHPDRLTHLILIDSSGYPHDSSNLISLARHSWLRPLINPIYGKYIIRMGLKQAYYDDSKVTPELVELYGRPFKTANGKDVPFWIFKSADSGDRDEDPQNIRSIKTPALIVWGENDTWIPVEHARFFHRDIKGSELVIIPACGHAPEEEKPDEVVRAILEFLQNSRA